MSVPETAMHKDNYLVPREYEVRFAGEIPYVQAEPKTETMCHRPHSSLRQGVFPPDAGHHATANAGRHRIHIITLERDADSNARDSIIQAHLQT